MKQFCLIICLACLSQQYLSAQNAGFGTTEAMNTVHIVGNLLVNQPTTATATAPTAAQIKTMVNASTTNFLGTDSTGRIYDPGGPSGNYLSNLIAYASISATTAITGYELTVETMGLGTGDSLIVKESSTASAQTLFAAGNGYTTTGKLIFNSTSLYIIFKSNADANNGAGFSLLFRRLYDGSTTVPAIAGVNGKAFFFDTKTGSLRSGLTNNSFRGDYSTALGYKTTATGYSATAIGYNTTAGTYSTAMGAFTRAGGDWSTAIGYYSTADAFFSTAIGNNAKATGIVSMATGLSTMSKGTATFTMGDSTTANSTASVAMGNRTVAGASYSLAMGDHTTTSGASSFAMGSYSNASGNSSVAMGKNSVASGFAATAMGGYSTASGDYSTAMGYGSATGERSTAMGDNAIASGAKSTAIGYYANATGSQTTAIGNNITANGSASVALGNFVSTNNKNGALVIGDNSTTTVLNSADNNTFRARFDGGYRFFTSASATTSQSCLLAAGSNAWSTTSDVKLKENFADINGEDFLKSIAGMKLTSWNYKTQNAKIFRHYGPMAQDFFAAFGKDKYGVIGNDSTINSADFDGVNLVAIQALEKRTAAQKLENEELKTLLQQLRKELDELKTAKPCDCPCPQNLLTAIK